MSLTRISLLFVVAILMSCAGDRKSPDLPDNTTPQIQQTNPGQINTDANATPPPTAEPAQNADGVWHYTCPNGCEGGAGAAGPCANCGTQLTHNTAYHGSIPTQDQVQQQLNNMQQDPQIQQAPPPTPEPAQNANGIWHYICSNGCPGGAGKAQACATCGSQLQHNTAYHQ